MRRPDFFIVGAPKCGTTALCTYLSTHPQVCFSPVKEPNFFAPDIGPKQRVSDLESYLALFNASSRKHVCVGEGTPFYLRSNCAVASILEFNPTAKFIVMLRNPVDAAYAFYTNHLYWGIEVVGSFDRAWHLQARRATGERVPRWCPSSVLLQYGWFYRLGEQVERLLAVAPRSQVHFILFDDFVANTGATYAGVLDFLGLAHDGTKDFPPVNANRSFRVPLLARTNVLLRRLPDSLERLKRLAKRSLGVETLGLHRLLHALNERANVVVAPRPPLSNFMRTELRRYFADDVARLACALQRDLSFWLEHQAQCGR